MTIDLSVTAMLFPAISLLLLAYTNRFLTIGRLIRDLHQRWTVDRSEVTRREIGNLRRRLHLIQQMQLVGVLALAASTVATVLVLVGLGTSGAIVFLISLLLLLLSLVISAEEIRISCRAIEMELQALEAADDAESLPSPAPQADPGINNG